MKHILFSNYPHLNRKNMKIDIKINIFAGINFKKK